MGWRDYDAKIGRYLDPMNTKEKTQIQSLSTEICTLNLIPLTTSGRTAMQQKGCCRHQQKTKSSPVPSIKSEPKILSTDLKKWI
jgi:hypothetical protein